MAKNIKFDESTYLKWIELYQNGMTLKEISLKYGVSSQTVGYHLEKRGVKRRTNAESHLKQLDITETMPNYKEKQVIIGSILGDGNITKQSLYSFLQISHAESQREWLEYKASLLGRFVTEKGVYTRNPAGPNRQNIVEVRTYQNKFIDELYQKSYRNEKKYLDNIYYLVDPLALAILWGDDGSYGKVNNKHEYGILSLCGFTFKENQLFSDFLLEKFSIKSTVLTKRVNGREYPQIRISKDGMERLREIINDYLPKTMKYKIGGESE